MEENQMPHYRSEAAKIMSEAKTLLDRLEKGHRVMRQQMARAEVSSVLDSVRLFNKLSKRIVDLTTLLLYITDFLIFNKTIVIDRTTGKPVKIETILKENTVRQIEVWEMESALILSSVFPKEFIYDGVVFAE